jgi:hypothetical protein
MVAARREGKIDLRDWDFGCGDLNGAIQKIMTRALRNTLDEIKPWASIRSICDGDVTIDLAMPFSADDADDHIYYCVSMKELIEECGWSLEERKALGATLHRLANKLMGE